MVVKTLLTAEFTPMGHRGHQEIGSAVSEQQESDICYLRQLLVSSHKNHLFKNFPVVTLKIIGLPISP